MKHLRSLSLDVLFLTVSCLFLTVSGITWSVYDTDVDGGAP